MEKVYSDLTVVGAGLAGMCAAIAAARHGLKVSLVHDRPVLGGNASSEICVCINGSAANGGSPSVYAREGGLIEEIKLTIQKYYPEVIKRTDPAILDVAFLEMIYQEKNIALYLNTPAYDVTVENDKIISIKARQFTTEKEFEFISQYYIDSSGDGIVAFKAGVPFMMGRESKDQFGESLAQDKPDSYTMGNTLIFETRDTGRKVVFKRPDFAYDITKMDFFKNLNKPRLHRPITRNGKNFSGYWWVEFGGQLDTVKDSEDITLELRKLVYGIWDYIKNSGDYEDVDNLILTWVSNLPGKRESRRFIGDYIFNQNDIDNKVDFPDSICIGGWTMDEHAPKGIYDDAPATHWYFVPGIYNIPFSSLYPKNITNLMFAGRNISATHIALSSTRVMATCACMGQAIGTAAYLCKKHSVSPMELKEKHIEELVSLLQREDQTLMGRQEKVNTELLRDLTINASSTREYNNLNSDSELHLDKDICMAVPVKTDYINSIDIRIKNKSIMDEEMTIALWGGKRPENYIPQYKIKDIKLTVPGNYDGWITLPLECTKPLDEKIYLLFAGQKELYLCTSSKETTGVILFNKNPGVTTMSNPEYPVRWSRLQPYPCFRNIIPVQNMYSVDNVLNGYSRPYGTPNMWSSALSKGSEEEWIEINYCKPKKLEEIQLVFNSGLKEDNLSNANLSRVIKDYEIEITSATGTSKKIEVKDNPLRFCRHILDAEDVTKIKFNFKATNGLPYYEVFSIKLF